MFGMSPLKNKKYYWMTLVSHSVEELALFGDRNGKYYCTQNGIFTPFSTFSVEAKIIVEKCPFQNEVREVLTGVKIPIVLLEVMRGEKINIRIDKGNIFEEYSTGYLPIGDTSQMVFAFAIQKNVRKGATDQPFELKEATKEEFLEYQKAYTLFLNRHDNFDFWKTSLKLLLESGKRKKKSILEENKEKLVQNKFGLNLKK